MKYGDDWKKIADEMGFKNKREAILEFIRAPIDELRSEGHQYVNSHAYQPKVQVKDFKDVEPYN